MKISLINGSPKAKNSCSDYLLKEIKKLLAENNEIYELASKCEDYFKQCKRTKLIINENPLDKEELLQTLGLKEHRYKQPNQLSGGQQQRTSIGRAIIKNPDLLLCDEPTGALDYHTSKDILQLIEDVNKKYGNTTIIVTHNDAIKDMADRVIYLHDGRIRENIKNTHKIPAKDLNW